MTKFAPLSKAKKSKAKKSPARPSELTRAYTWLYTQGEDDIGATPFIALHTVAAYEGNYLPGNTTPSQHLL